MSINYIPSTEIPSYILIVHLATEYDAETYF